MVHKKTLVLGASENPSRYSNMAVKRLLEKGIPVRAVGNRLGRIEDVTIETGTPFIDGVDTVTLYLSRKNQAPLYDYILGLTPKRIIFNPGAENSEFVELANKKSIYTVEACTLVLLSIGGY